MGKRQRKEGSKTERGQKIVHILLLDAGFGCRAFQLFFLGRGVRLDIHPKGADQGYKLFFQFTNQFDNPTNHLAGQILKALRHQDIVIALARPVKMRDHFPESVFKGRGDSLGDVRVSERRDMCFTTGKSPAKALVILEAFFNEWLKGEDTPSEPLMQGVVALLNGETDKARRCQGLRVRVQMRCPKRVAAAAREEEG